MLETGRKLPDGTREESTERVANELRTHFKEKRTNAQPMGLFLRQERQKLRALCQRLQQQLLHSSGKA